MGWRWNTSTFLTDLLKIYKIQYYWLLTSHVMKEMKVNVEIVDFIFLCSYFSTSKNTNRKTTACFFQESTNRTQTNRSTVQNIMTHQTAAQKTSVLFHALDFIPIYSQFCLKHKKDHIFPHFISFLRAFVNISLSFWFVSSHDISVSTDYKYT